MKKVLKQTFMMLIMLLLCTGFSVTAHAVSLNKKSLTLYTRQTYQLKASGGKISSCKSSRNSVASVGSKTGLIKAKTAGAATINVKVGKKNLTCKVTVKNSIELTKYLGSTAKLKKALGYLRQAKPGEEPVKYTGTLYFDKNASVSNGHFFIRTDKPGGRIIILQNSKRKQYLLYGVRIGDSASSADKILRKNGFKLESTNNRGRLYKKGSVQVRLWISNQKVVTYSGNWVK